MHNEEHGGVILWWGPGVSTGTVDELERFYRASPVAMLGTPIADALGLPRDTARELAAERLRARLDFYHPRG